MGDKKYDPNNINSIVEYAHKLVGSTLREQISIESIENPKVRKGSWANAVEEYYFQYKLNSDPNPDFANVGLELKTNSLRRATKGALIAKERLVLTMIDYMAVVNEEFEHSHLMNKIRQMLLISYLWEKDKDPLDYEVMLSVLWSVPEKDLPQIQRDWETIVRKIREGKAHEISCSDTLYLEACTKAKDSSVRRQQPFSDIPAKPRAWALKKSYMSTVYNNLLNLKGIQRTQEEKDLDLLSLVRRRFEPYFHLTENELAQQLGVSKSKNMCARITKRILGIEEDAKIEEFEKAGIKPKTLRLKKSGRPAEAVSFPAFNYNKMAEQEFEESDFYNYLQTRYLFVLYRECEDGLYRLEDICFWQMPDSDLKEAAKCYRKMQRNVISGNADISVKSTENRCCHVRPHGRNAKDTLPTPHNGNIVKKSFWLNQEYLKEEIKKACHG